MERFVQTPKSAWHLEKQDVKYVRISELKRICYKEPFRGNSDCWPHMQDGGQQEVKQWCSEIGIVDGTNKRGRPCREWMDDIVSWCKTGLQELNSLAQDRRRWKLITRQAMDTNGLWSHGSWRRRSWATFKVTPPLKASSNAFLYSCAAFDKIQLHYRRRLSTLQAM